MTVWPRLPKSAALRAASGTHAPRPDVRFEVIAGAGHVCNVEQPEAYNRHLLTFLQRLT